MTEPADTPTTQRLGRLIAGAFSLAIILVIAFFVLDEANARFGAIAVSVVIVLLTRPAVRVGWMSRRPAVGWILDLSILAGFAFSTWYFFKVKEELWTGFYMATPMNIAAGLAGLVAIVLLTYRAWGWSLVIMAALVLIV